MDPVKQFDRVVLTMENVIIPEDRLLNTPSQRDGMDRELEIDLRLTGCDYIQSAGLLLKLPQVAMATAQILFHRYYYAKSFVNSNCYYAIMACLFLAAKIEENSRRLRDVINVFHHLRQKRKGSLNPVPMEYVGNEYFSMRTYINKYERYILKELGFCVHVQHPHKLIIATLQILELEKNNELAQKAWNFMNDGLRTNVFVRFSVQALACSCIFLAARQLKIHLPTKPAWWELFDTKYKDIQAICLELIALYKRPIRSLHELEKEVEKIEKPSVAKTPKSDNSTPPASQIGSPALLTVNNSQKESPQKSTTTSPLVESTKAAIVVPPSSSLPVNGRQKRSSSVSPPLPPVKKRAEERPHTAAIVEGGEGGNDVKPIISPIRISSSGDSEEEGLPLRYRLSPKRSRHTNNNKSVNKHHKSSDRRRRSGSRESRKRKVHSKHGNRHDNDSREYDKYHYR